MSGSKSVERMRGERFAGNMDLVDFARYFGAMALVLGLLGVAALAARRFGIPGIAKGDGLRRLAVSETLMLGPRYKLLLVRRDNAEHLILMGPAGATLLENGIQAPPQRVAPAEGLS